MFQLASLWLIPVANLYRPVNSHPDLFKSALSWGTPPLDTAIVEKELGRDLRANVTQNYIEFLGFNGRVSGATIPAVPKGPAVNCLPSRSLCSPLTGGSVQRLAEKTSVISIGGIFA